MKFTRLFLLAALLPFMVLSAFAQKGQTQKTQAKKEEPYQVSATGVKYKMHKDADGRAPKVGDIMEVHITNRNAKDSLLFSTYESGSPVPIQLANPEYKGDLMDGLAMLSANDSATIWIAVDSFRDFKPTPGLEKGTLLRYTIKVLGVYTREEFSAKANQAGLEQMKKDSAAINEYLKANKIKNFQRTPSGLYYVIDKKGADAKVIPERGKSVKVHYTGTLLNGKQFDSSRERGEPFEFTLGAGQVIRGWDEGIALLSKGTRGRLFIPSHLGYGARGAGATIPGNSVLIFDVELIDFK